MGRLLGGGSGSAPSGLALVRIWSHPVEQRGGQDVGLEGFRPPILSDLSDHHPVKHCATPLYKVTTPPKPNMSPVAPNDTVYFSGAYDAAKSFTLGQGLESVSRDGMQRIVNKEWTDRHE